MTKKLNKKEAQTLEKRLAYRRRLTWDELTSGEEQKVWELAEDYKLFLNASKTERETILEISRRLTQSGFRSLDHSDPGRKVFQIIRGKALALGILGKKPLSRGVQIIASHVDASRLDLKQHPLYEEVDLAFLKTHYYGGIKKYQWLARPLALHGTVLTADGKKIDLAIGENAHDPVFTVADLLPHLARKVQMEKKLYGSLKAALEVENPDRSSVVLFLDKEEIGSEGNTSARAQILENFLPELFSLNGEKLTYQGLHETLASSRAISADVAGALDPDYQEVHEKRNAPRMGGGLCLTKFTGSAGKYGSSDANAEYVFWIRDLFNREKIVWQTGELGKVDEGGGGTIAKFLAVLGMEIVDCGTPVLSMHSPFELVSKADMYMTYKGFKAFLLAP
jgi:aspartyl aminopeptidase